MTKHQKIQLIIASLLGAISISLASVGAHAIYDQLVAGGLLATFHKATDYAMYHALALVGIAALQSVFPKSRLYLVGYLWTLGALLFSGSLFLHTMAGLHDLTFLTPIGGMLMIFGWLLLGILALIHKDK